MKKIFSITLLSFLLLVNNSFAKHNFYIGTNIQHTNYDFKYNYNDDNGITKNKSVFSDDKVLSGISIGARFYFMDTKLFISPELTINISNNIAEEVDASTLNKTSIKELVSNNLKFGYDLKEKLSVFVLVGGSLMKNTVFKSNYPGSNFIEDEFKTINIGFGFEYFIKNNIAFGLCWVMKNSLKEEYVGPYYDEFESSMDSIIFSINSYF